jgi:hypothetical protein
MSNTYKKAKYVRNRLEDELEAAKEKMKKLLADNYETEFPNSSNDKKKNLTNPEKDALANIFPLPPLACLLPFSFIHSLFLFFCLFSFSLFFLHYETEFPYEQ